MKASRVLGVLVLAVELFVLVSFSLSMVTIYGVITKTLSKENLTMTASTDDETNDTTITMEATCINPKLLPLSVELGLDADLTLEAALMDEGGNSLAEDSASLYLKPGTSTPLRLELVISGEDKEKYSDSWGDVYFEVRVGVRTLYDLVGFSEITRIRGGVGV